MNKGKFQTRLQNIKSTTISLSNEVLRSSDNISCQLSKNTIPTQTAGKYLKVREEVIYELLRNQQRLIQLLEDSMTKPEEKE